MAPKQLPIRLPDDVRRRLEVEAARLELSLNAVIVTLLDRCLPQIDGTPTAPPRAAPAPPDDDDDQDSMASFTSGGQPL